MKITSSELSPSVRWHYRAWQTANRPNGPKPSWQKNTSWLEKKILPRTPLYNWICITDRQSVSRKMMEKQDEFILFNLSCQKEGDSFNQASVEHLVSVYRQGSQGRPSIISDTDPHQWSIRHTDSSTANRHLARDQDAGQRLWDKAHQTDTTKTTSVKI